MSSDDSSQDINLTTVYKNAGIRQPNKPPMTAPPMPSHFVGRGEELRHLKHALIGGDSADRVALTAVQGMGGIGKSVLAIALCHDPETQTALPGGIIWVTIGRDPASLLEKLKSVGAAIGDNLQEYYGSEDNASSRLRSLLPELGVLLVLDDVWDRAHIQPFLFTSEVSRILITTRQIAIADELGAMPVRLDILKPDEAVELLEKASGKTDADFPQLAKRVGYLPLALEIAGLNIRKSGTAAAEWLAKFDSLKQIKKGRKADASDTSLEKSISQSVETVFDVEDDRVLYYSLGIFREDIWIPQTAIVKLWRALFPDLGEADCKQILVELVDLALLERREEDETISMHDLLHDYTLEQLGSRTPATHQALLDAYNPDDQPWHQVADRYLFENLAYHLIQLDRRADLIAILTTSPDWMNHKFYALAADAPFLEDVRLAAEPFADPLEADDLLILLRLHMTRQVVHARVGSYKDDDLKILTLCGQKAKALSFTRLRKEPFDRCRSLLAICEVGPDDEDAPALLTEALTEARSIKAASSRAWALNKIAGILAEAGRADHAVSVLDEGLLATRNVKNASWRALVLRDIAWTMAKARRADYAMSILDESLLVAQSLEHVLNRASTLNGIAGALVNAGQLDRALGVWDEALLAARSAKEDKVGSRASSVRDIAEKLAKAGQFDRALEVARSVEYVNYRASVLRGIAEKLMETGQFDRALEVARSVEDANDRARALSAIAGAQLEIGPPDHALGVWDEALQAARSVEDAYRRARILKDIAEKLAEAGRTDYAVSVLDEGLLVARGIEYAYRLAWVLNDIAGVLVNTGRTDHAVSILDESLLAARSIEDTSIHTRDLRAMAFSDIARTLAEAGQLDRALEVARSMDAASGRTRALNGIAQALAETGQFDRALEVARSVEASHISSGALRGIAEKLMEAGQFDRAVSVLDEGLLVARSAENPFSRRARVLKGVAERLAKAGQLDNALGVLDEAIRSTQSLNLDPRAWALIAIAQTLVKAGQLDRALGVLDSALQAARSLGGSRGAWAMGSIAWILAEVGQFDRTMDVWDEALQTARNVEDADGRAWALSEIAPTLAKTGQFDRALEVARSIEVASTRAWALSAIARTLVKTGQRDRALDLWGEALQIARSEENEDSRASTMVTIAETLAEVGLIKRAFKVARNVEDTDGRARALSAIARTLAAVGQHDRAQGVWHEALQAARSVVDAFKRASALSVIAEKLAGSECFDRALEVARSVEDESYRDRALSAIAKKLAAAEQTDWALEIAGEVYTEGLLKNRAKVLASVALSKGFENYTAKEAVFNTMLAAAYDIKRSYYRKTTLQDVAKSLGKFRRYCAALDALDGGELTGHFKAIAEWVPTLESMRGGLSMEVVNTVLEMERWAWSG